MLFASISDETGRSLLFLALLACFAVWRVQNKVKAAIKQHDPDGQFRSKVTEAAKDRFLDWLKKK